MFVPLCGPITFDFTYVTYKLVWIVMIQVDTCPYLNVYGKKIHWTQALPYIVNAVSD